MTIVRRKYFSIWISILTGHTGVFITEFPRGYLYVKPTKKITITDYTVFNISTLGLHSVRDTHKSYRRCLLLLLFRWGESSEKKNIIREICIVYNKSGDGISPCINYFPAFINTPKLNSTIVFYNSCVLYVWHFYDSADWIVWLTYAEDEDASRLKRFIGTKSSCLFCRYNLFANISPRVIYKIIHIHIIIHVHIIVVF